MKVQQVKTLKEAKELLSKGTKLFVEVDNDSQQLNHLKRIAYEVCDDYFYDLTDNIADYYSNMILDLSKDQWMELLNKLKQDALYPKYINFNSVASIQFNKNQQDELKTMLKNHYNLVHLAEEFVDVPILFDNNVRIKDVDVKLQGIDKLADINLYNSFSLIAKISISFGKQEQIFEFKQQVKADDLYRFVKRRNSQILDKNLPHLPSEDIYIAPLFENDNDIIKIAGVKISKK